MEYDFCVSKLLMKYRIAIILIAIIACIFTWYLDLAGLVFKCPYCRVQRTIIGLLAIIGLLPDHKNSLLRYICYLLAFFGADVSGDQIFLSIKVGMFPTINSILASCAFVLIGALTVITHYRFSENN
jgi:disulfide bond formation protein DsbB